MAEPLTALALPAFSNRERNPYNALLYGAVLGRGVDVREYSSGAALRGRPGIVHVHWPESHLNHRHWVRASTRSARRLAELAVARRRGARLVWTVHNLGSHEHRYARTEAWFWRAFVPMVDGWVALSGSGAEAAIDRWPALADVPHTVAPHGHYRGAYPDSVTAERARDALGWGGDAPTAGFVGRIKRYKGVAELIDAFSGIDDPDARLLVAGRVETDDLAIDLRARAARDGRITLREGVVSDDQLQVVLRACDLVVAPFVDVLNSGSVLLALSFDRAVLVPAIGAMPSLAADIDGGWVQTYDPPLTAERLREAIATARTLTGAPDLGRFDWDVAAARHVELYREVTHENASRR
jgi:beta-1,4-mannosyltransferase